jgi:hypothetical protein
MSLDEEHGALQLVGRKHELKVEGSRRARGQLNGKRRLAMWLLCIPADTKAVWLCLKRETKAADGLIESR